MGQYPFHRPRHSVSGREKYGGVHRQSAHSQSGEEVEHFAGMMPPRPTIGAASTAPALLPVEQARPVEPADGKALPRHPHDLGHGLPLIIHEAQGRDRDHPVETAIGKRQARASPTIQRIAGGPLT